MSTFAFGVALTIRVTLLLIVVAAVAIALRKRSAALQHALWSGAIVASLALPIISIAFAKSGAPAIALTDVNAAWTWITRSVVQHQSSFPSPRNVASPGTIDSRTSNAIAEILNFTTARVGVTPRIATVAITLWLAGLNVFFIRLLASILALGRLTRRATTVDDARILSLVAESTSGRGKQVKLVESRQIAAPATGGILQPTIFLPPDASDWTSTRLRATLAHEYAHVERRDCLTQLGADVARAIYWFNPLIWYARRRIIIERERACDDIVMASGIRAERYATVLVDTIRGSLAHPGTIALGALSMARPSELETRLVSILDPSRVRTPLSRAKTTAIVTVVALLTIVVAGSRVEAAPAMQFLEPDMRGDSIAGPLSEKLQLDPNIYRVVRNSSALHGPDSALAHLLYTQLDRIPTWYGDLVRDRSAWALSIARNGELVAPLINALADRDWRVRAYAAWTLGESRDARALPSLMPLLDSPNWRMRAMAAYAVQSIASPTSATRMSLAIHDEAWQVRLGAVRYFSALHDPRYKSILEGALFDRHFAVRTNAEEALGSYTTNF